MIEEQIGNIGKHTNNRNVIEDSVNLVEHTTSFEEPKQIVDLAKTSIETEKLASGKKEDKPSIHVKVFLICMKCKVELYKDYFTQIIIIYYDSET